MAGPCARLAEEDAPASKVWSFARGVLAQTRGTRGCSRTSLRRRKSWQEELHSLRESLASRLWNPVLLCTTSSACEKAGRWAVAAAVLSEARTSQVSLDEFSWSPLLRGCARAAAWSRAFAMLFRLPSRRLDFSVVSASAAISGVSPWAAAQAMLRSMVEAGHRLNLVAFNAAKGDWKVVLGLQLLRQRQLQPDDVSLLAILKQATLYWETALRLLLRDRLHFSPKTLTSFLGIGPWPLGLVLQRGLLALRVESDAALERSLLRDSAERGQWRRVLLECWNADALRSSTGLSACAVTRRWQRSLHLLLQLQRRGASDAVCVHGAADAAEWRWALHLLGQSWRQRLQRDVVAYGTLISGGPWQLGIASLQEMPCYQVIASRAARNAALADTTWPLALRLFEEVVQPGEITYRALLGCLEEGGEDDRAIELLWHADAAGVVHSASFYLWAMERLSVSDAECLVDALQVALAGLKAPCSPQELATILWSAASLGIRQSRLVELVAAQALRQMSAFEQTDLLFLAIGAGDMVAAGESKGLRLCHAIEQEMVLRLKRLRASGSCAQRAKVAEDVLGVVWALRFAKLGASLLAPALRAMRRLAGGLDEIRRGLQNAGEEVHGSSVTLRLTDDKPKLLAMGDRLLALKPPGWETVGSTARQLPDYLQDLGIDFPVLRDKLHQCGFIHRLDVPSSGLVLCGLTYQAYYNLKLELAFGRIGRQYTVLAHGFLVHRSEVRVRVSWKDTGPPGPSRCGRGKPSVSYLQRRAVAFLPSHQAATLLTISLGTGRRHQIRAHLAFIGHPVVCDGKYSSAETFRLDDPLCPQNCLHRHGLSVGKRRFSAPLPSSFAQLLQVLQGRAAADSEALRSAGEPGDLQALWNL